ncbi:unnamed protein product [Acanthoscelides obtectus]|nr:unnamed protein product [Acanthoscelides obtectus]CAK1640383.1 Probable RNA-binding protein 46 [Acanthoscelides obtectus]
MYHKYDQPELNRGFVFVEFQSHRAAAMARRQFAPENLICWGRKLYVDWADPLPEVDPEVLAKVTVLYLRHLPLDYTADEVYTMVCNIVGSQILKKVHKANNFAFVHFYERRDAEFALERLQYVFRQTAVAIDVEWARPREYSKKHRLNSTPQNFCRSVPPALRRLVYEHANQHARRSRYISFNTYVEEASTTTSSINSYGPYVASPQHDSSDGPYVASPQHDSSDVDGSSENYSLYNYEPVEATYIRSCQNHYNFAGYRSM